jgi:mRNA-degrading endonuclease YafQ of YafQ-DinJ toxin-antitoxin module
MNKPVCFQTVIEKEELIVLIDIGTHDEVY